MSATMRGVCLHEQFIHGQVCTVCARAEWVRVGGCAALDSAAYSAESDFTSGSSAARQARPRRNWENA
jgi:hypothetical protein